MQVNIHGAYGASGLGQEAKQKTKTWSIRSHVSLEACDLWSLGVVGGTQKPEGSASSCDEDVPGEI